MNPNLRLAIVLVIGLLLLGTEVAVFRGDLASLFARETALGLEIMRHTHLPGLSVKPSQEAMEEDVLPAKCRDEKTIVMRPQDGSYSVRLPISWQSNEYQGASTDFYTVCSLSGMLDSAYGADGELHTDWEMHQIRTTADAWFKAGVEVSDAAVKATIASQKRELKDSTLSPADFHSERTETTIDGRHAIRYTTFWDKPPFVEGGPNMERFYVVADAGKVYVFRAGITRGPHEQEVMALFDEVVKSVHFGPSTI